MSKNNDVTSNENSKNAKNAKNTVPSLAADWRQLVQRLLKAEMSKRGTKYQDLSDRLSNIGIYQSADNLRNKVNKGIMGADLLLQIMYVLNMRKIERDDIIEIFADLDSPLE
ncbi:MAG: hypothetical protein ACJAV1_000120 [Paraglaciecola sp.]|jgi:hypothetical protein